MQINKVPNLTSIALSPNIKHILLQFPAPESTPKPIHQFQY